MVAAVFQRDAARRSETNIRCARRRGVARTAVARAIGNGLGSCTRGGARGAHRRVAIAGLTLTLFAARPRRSPMSSIPTHLASGGDATLIAVVTESFFGARTLADVLEWARRQRPVVSVLEIVTQDEFTHDVVLPFGRAFLSFDTT